MKEQNALSVHLNTFFFYLFHCVFISDYCTALIIIQVENMDVQLFGYCLLLFSSHLPYFSHLCASERIIVNALLVFKTLSLICAQFPAVFCIIHHLRRKRSEAFNAAASI